MSDREEIRWKFQVMLENLEMVRDQFENERKFIDERHRRAIRDLEKMRNYWFTGIGFFMTIFTSMILAKNLDNIYFVYPIVAGVFGFVIFFITNLKMATAHVLFREVDDVYYLILNGTLIPTKGMISTYALIDDYSKEDTMLLVSYVSLLGKAVSYQLIRYMDEKLNLKQFKLEEFRQHYVLAKTSLSTFKEKNYALGTIILEEFMVDFEKAEKKKQSRSKKNTS